MATGNRHKISIKPIKLPPTDTDEDRGLGACCDPFLVLASTTLGDRYHNDISGFAQKLFSEDDTADWFLEYEGADITPLGVVCTFPHEEFVSAIVVNWREHLANNGAGCYRVRCDWSIGGITGSYYKGSYDLQPWTIENASGTVRILSTYNDFSRALQIDFTESGFNDTLRFSGSFGYMQPNIEINNHIDVNFVQRKVTNENIKSFELEMHPTTDCYTSRLIDDHLLHANDIWISDHNATNHSWKYKDLPVILKKETTPSLEYPDGSRYASVKATFEEKVLTQESQYAGGLVSGTNASYVLTGSAGAIGLVTIHNSDDSFTDTASGGSDVLLPDIEITTGDGVLTFPSVVDVDLSSYFEVSLPTGTRVPVNTVTDPTTQVAWETLVNTSTSDQYVEKLTGGTAWNAKANFKIPTTGEFSIEFSINGDDTFAGITYVDINSNYTDIQYSISYSGSSYYIYSNGNNLTSFVGPVGGDIQRIDRLNNEVRFYVNNVLKYTLPTTGTGTNCNGHMVFDCSLRTPGDYIEWISLTFL